MNMLREFFTSSSGLAPARQGLSLGWVISACVGVAILIGAGKAEAVSCPGYEILCDLQRVSRILHGSFADPVRLC